MQTTVGGARCPGGRRRGRRWRSGGLYVDFLHGASRVCGREAMEFFLTNGGVRRDSLRGQSRRTAQI